MSEEHPESSSGGRGAGTFWRRAAAAVRARRRVAAPIAIRFGEWLVQLSWRRFALLAFLLLATAGVLTSVLSSHKSTVVTERSLGNLPIVVNVTVSPTGITVAPGDDKSNPAVPPAPPAPPPAVLPPPSSEAVPPVPPATARKRSHHEDDDDDDDDSDNDKNEGTATVDDKGVHLVAPDDNGQSVAIDIDSHGVRVDRRGKGGTLPPLTLPVPLGNDPARLAEIGEALRPQVEAIARSEVQHRIRRVEVSRAVERGDWIVSMCVVLLLTLVIVKLVLGSKSKAEMRARAATATAVEEGLKRQVVEANLKMMQAQVEPHFLFNTLASVDYLIETDPARASKMQKNLIQYLRAALPQMREGSATLGKEVSLCRSYLEILKVRMEDRLQFALNVPAGLLSAQFPPMVLPTLVENAIKHGLEPKPEGGSLTVAADISDGKLRVTVADTGLGFGAAGSQPGTGVGLNNIRERLAALFGNSGKLDIEANAPAGTIVRIEIPYRLEPAPSAAAMPA